MGISVANILKGGTHEQYSRENRDVDLGRTSSERRPPAGKSGDGAILSPEVEGFSYLRFLHSPPVPSYGLRCDFRSVEMTKGWSPDLDDGGARTCGRDGRTTRVADPRWEGIIMQSSESA